MCPSRRTERIHYPWDDDGLGSDHFPHEKRRKYRRVIGSTCEERCESGRIGLTANPLRTGLRREVPDSQGPQQARTDTSKIARIEKYRRVIGATLRTLSPIDDPL